ncbi:MAG: FlgD immunoglobulin-like domain containing protein, partial [Candidatus Marinimicrobia bacterium]|nr:FlgD immunoglobulin-like domain containing protein [Candidatus Neomarinimicrobiota bacterium]
RIGDLIDVNFTPANKFSGSSLVELKDVTLAGQAGEEVSVSTASYEVSFVTPQKTSLSENYPNPFNPSTTIDYQIAEPGKVSIIVYDLKGAEVNILVNQYQDAAYHSVVWNGLNDNGLAVASGRYILKMNAPGYSETITMTLLK